jgi:hypothetical protein
MEKTDISHVELAEDSDKQSTQDGQVELFKDNRVVLIPAPSADPRGMSSYSRITLQAPDVARSIEPSSMAQMGSFSPCLRI